MVLPVQKLSSISATTCSDHCFNDLSASGFRPYKKQNELEPENAESSQNFFFAIARIKAKKCWPLFWRGVLRWKANLVFLFRGGSFVTFAVKSKRKRFAALKIIDWTQIKFGMTWLLEVQYKRKKFYNFSMSKSQRKFAVFDIDGTLVRWQMFHTVAQQLADRGYLGKDASRKLKEARLRWKNREGIESFHDYEASLVQLYEAGLLEIDPKDFDEVSQKVVAEYKDQVYTYTRDLCRQLKAKGYFLIAISGSHHELIGELVKHYDFDDWVGTLYERKDGKYTGQSFLPIRDKKAVLMGLIEKHNLTLNGSYAVGDSKSDAVMLEMVDNPIAFNPEKRLLEIAKQKSWKIVVERKNVVYKLEKKDVQYLLAEAGE